MNTSTRRVSSNARDKEIVRLREVEKKSIGEISFELKIRSSTIFKVLQKLCIKKKAEADRKKRKKVKRKPLIDRRFPKMLALAERNVTIQEIARGCSISTQKALWILESHGVDRETVRSLGKPYYGITSDELEKRHRELRYHAFIAGLSVSEYTTLRKRIGVARFAKLREHMSTSEKNHKLLKNAPDGPIHQMSALELFLVYVDAGQRIFPGTTELAAFDAITSADSGYMLVRTNWRLPYITENVNVVSRTEFGNRLANEYGVLVPSNPLYQKQNRNRT